IIEAEYRYGIRIREGVVRLHQQSSQCWLHTKNIEVISGNNFRCDELRLVVPLHAGFGSKRCYEPIECGVAIAQIAIHGIREIKLVVRTRSSVAAEPAREFEDDQLRWLFHGQAAQQGLVE